MTRIASLEVGSAFDPAGLEAGLDRGLRDLQGFVAKTAGLNTPVTLDLRLANTDVALAQVEQFREAVSPAAFEAFSQAATGSFQQVATSLEQLTGLVTAALGPVAGFFQGLEEGAAGALAELQGGAAAAAGGLDELVPSEAAATEGADTMAQGLALAAVQAKELADAEAFAATGAGKMAAGIALASEQLAAEQAGLAAASAGLDRVGRAHESVLAHGIGGARALHTVASAATVLGAEALGAEGPLLRLGEGLVLFSGGIQGILLAGAGLAAVGVIFEHLTEETRKHREETEKTEEALKRLKAQQAGPIVAAQTAFDTQREEVERLSRALADLTVRQQEAAAAPAGRSGVPSLGAQNDLLSERARLTKELAEASDLLAVASQGLTDAENHAHGAEVLRALDLEVKSFGLSEIAARELAITLDGKLTDAQKKAAKAALDTLDGLQQHKKAIDDLLKGTNLPEPAIGLDQAIKALDAALGKPHPVSIFLDTSQVDRQVTDLLKKIETRQQEQARNALDLLPAPETGIAAGFDAATASVGGLEDALQRAFVASGKFGAAAVRAATDTRTPFAHLADDLDDVTRGLDDISRQAASVGAISQQADQAISSVLGLVDAVGHLRDSLGNLTAGGVLGLIGAGIGAIGAIGGLLGPSKEDQERDRLLAENNRRLDELNSSLGQTLTIGDAANAQVLAAFGAAERLAALQTPGKTGPGGLDSSLQDEAARNAAITAANRDFQKALADSGLTLQDFARIVKEETGLDILDDKGHLVADTLAQADAGLKKVIDRLTHFQDTFTDQLDFADLKAKINGGLGDATDQFQRDLAAAGSVGSDFVAHFFDGIDTNDKAAFQAKLNEFADLFGPDSTFFKEHPDLLKGLGIDDWKRILNDGAAAVGDLTKSVDDATASFQDFNLPSGFRREGIAFATADAQPFAVPAPFHPVFDQGAGLPSLALPDIFGAGGAARGSDGAALPTFGRAVRKLADTIEINVTVQGVGETVGRDIAEQVYQALRDKAMLQTGDSLDAGFF